MPDAAIVIVTRNRFELCAKTIESALTLSGDLEILVIDDGSTDGTTTQLSARFPTIRVHRSETQQGYIVQRNLAATLVSSPIIVSIDDDAIFTAPDTVQIALRLFDEPRVGAVSLAFFNRVDGGEYVMQAVAPDGEDRWVTNTFIGTAYALRRDVFQALGGFREEFFHWSEELDYSQRLFRNGYVVLVALTGPIIHMPTNMARNPKVNTRVTRNSILTIFWNAPARLVVPLIGGLIVRNLLSAARRGTDFGYTLIGSFQGLGGVWKYRRLRAPLSIDAFRLWMEIRKRRPVRLSEIESRLPPLRNEETRRREGTKDARR